MSSKKTRARMESGEIIHQKCWQYIKEVNGTDPEHLRLIAVTDSRRDYTYLQMYELWERYASVFSALGITGSNGSRAGITGAASAEVTFAFFGLNMTGASVSMLQVSSENTFERLREVVRKEKLTDLILVDYLTDACLLRQLLREKGSMGLRNLIVLHIPVNGAFAFTADKCLSRINHRRMREAPGAVFMDELLEKYGDHGICYADKTDDEAAVIVHTSGTTEGVPKPVPLSDSAINETLRRHTVSGRTAPKGTRMKSLVHGTLFRGAEFIGTLTPLANGGNLVTLPTVIIWFNLIAAVEYYHATNLVYFSALIDLFDLAIIKPDLSSLQSVLLVGDFVSTESIRKCRDFFRACGSDANILVGYGLTEAGVGLTLSDPDTEDDSVGYLLPGVKAKFWNEDKKRFYEPDGKEHTGVLYVSTPSLSSGRLDDEVIFELDEIDGEKYLSTNDLFRINEDGALYCIGRANRFFINEKGVKFDAGLVERAVAAQKGIRSCGLVAEYNKQIHDTEPALYVETDRPGMSGYRIIKDALEQVYIKEGLIRKTALPVRCVLTGHIPRNAGGKVDIHQITEGNVHGLSYKVEGVFENKDLKGIDLIPGGAGPAYLGCDCAFQ